MESTALERSQTSVTAGVGVGGSERCCSYKLRFVCLRICGGDAVREAEGKSKKGGQEQERQGKAA